MKADHYTTSNFDDGMYQDIHGLRDRTIKGERCICESCVGNREGAIA